MFYSSIHLTTPPPKKKGFSNPIQKIRRAAQVLGSKGIKAIRQMAGHVFLREFAMEKPVRKHIKIAGWFNMDLWMIIP